MRKYLKKTDKRNRLWAFMLVLSLMLSLASCGAREEQPKNTEEGLLETWQAPVKFTIPVRRPEGVQEATEKDVLMFGSAYAMLLLRLPDIGDVSFLSWDKLADAKVKRAEKCLLQDDSEDTSALVFYQDDTFYVVAGEHETEVILADMLYRMMLVLMDSGKTPDNIYYLYGMADAWATEVYNGDSFSAPYLEHNSAQIAAFLYYLYGIENAIQMVMNDTMATAIDQAVAPGMGEKLNDAMSVLYSKSLFSADELHDAALVESEILAYLLKAKLGDVPNRELAVFGLDGFLDVLAMDGHLAQSDVERIAKIYGGAPYFSMNPAPRDQPASTPKPTSPHTFVTDSLSQIPMVAQT